MEGGNKIFMSKSRTFLMCCFCFIVGILIFSVKDLNKDKLYYFLIVFWILIFFLIVFWQKIILKFFIFFLLFFIFGCIRVLLYQPDITPNYIAYYNEQEVEFIGKIIKEPDVRIDKTYYVVNAERLLTNGKNIKGKVKIAAPLYPKYNYGDFLGIRCELQTPKPVDDFRYDKFLALEKVYSVCYYPKIVNARLPVVNSLKDKFYKKIFQFKNIIANKINLLYPEPEASFMAGLLYGYRGGLPEDLQENFNRTGLTHIVAISGFNISIISISLMYFFILIGFWRRQAFWLTICGIFLFVIFVGSSPSVARAAVMGGIVLTAQYFGRPSIIFNIIILSLSIMLFINPLSLVWDVGFQLSFASVVGLVYLSPILEKIIKNFLIPSLSIFNFAFKLILATFSAIIVATPLVLYHFGKFSLVALLTNLLVLWFVPYLMLIGFLGLVFSFVLFPFGQTLSWLGYLGLKYVILIVDFFGAQSWSAVNFNFNLFGLIAFYLIGFLFYKKLK